MRRWLAAAVALGLGAVVTAVLLWSGGPARGAADVFIATRDVAEGGQVGDAIALAQVATPAISTAFTRRDAAVLESSYATHALVAGQLIQRSDVGPAPADVRLVFVPAKDAPAAEPGSRLDFLTVSTDPSGVTSVQPFANGVEVRASTNGGFVVAVSSRQAAAFVYAAATMHLVAVADGPDGGGGAEVPVSSPDQATQIAAQP